MELNINVLFNRVIKLIFAVILLALIIALIIGCGKLFLGIWITIAAPGITGRYLDIITDVQRKVQERRVRPVCCYPTQVVQAYIAQRQCSRVSD